MPGESFFRVCNLHFMALVGFYEVYLIFSKSRLTLLQNGRGLRQISLMLDALQLPLTCSSAPLQFNRFLFDFTFIPARREIRDWRMHAHAQSVCLMVGSLDTCERARVPQQFE